MFAPKTAPSRPNINEIHMAIALYHELESDNFFSNFDELKTSAYLKAVGYSSTATEFNTFTAKPEIMSALNPYTCTKGRSVTMHTIPPKPHTVKTKTFFY